MRTIILCEASTFWRWTGNGFRWLGNIDPAPLHIDPNDNTIFLSLVGDEAWARNAAHNGFIKFDLLSMSASAAGSMPISEEQPDVDGFTYRFEKQDVKHMKLVRESAAPELPTFCPYDRITRQQVAAIVITRWSGFPSIQATRLLLCLLSSSSAMCR